MGQSNHKMDQVKFVEQTISLNRPYPFKSFKGCLPQNLLGSFLNTLSQIDIKKLQKICLQYFI